MDGYGPDGDWAGTKALPIVVYRHGRGSPAIAPPAGKRARPIDAHGPAHDTALH